MAFNSFGSIHDEHVLSVIATTPREQFVPDEYLAYAYENRPLPIGLGQTISQPYIVALMTELLELNPADKVLEIGTGSGYQTAILSQLVREVYTVEIIRPLSERAHNTLAALGLNNIQFRVGDGHEGWVDHAPYDAIIVTAASETAPPPLIEQMAEGGRMVIPIGAPDTVQTLWKMKKIDENIRKENHGPVRFVPFTRQDHFSGNPPGIFQD